MLVFLSIWACLALTNARVLAPNAPVNIRSKRMIGGRDSTIQEHPYHVAIELKNSDYHCSGAIISKKNVLTVAHCLYDMNISKYQIRSGTSVMGKDGELHDLEDVVIHPHYAENEYSYSRFDIAIVYVKSAFKYSEFCRPIALQTGITSGSFVANETVTLSSWGNVDDDRTMLISLHEVNVSGCDHADQHGTQLPLQLQTMQVPWISKQECNRSYVSYAGIYEGQICVGYVDDPSKTLCSGDSGSPMVLNNKITGVAAYSKGRCGLHSFPMVYTEVAYFYSWIKNYVESDE